MASGFTSCVLLSATWHFFYILDKFILECAESLVLSFAGWQLCHVLTISPAQPCRDGDYWTKWSQALWSSWVLFVSLLRLCSGTTTPEVSLSWRPFVVHSWLCSQTLKDADSLRLLSLPASRTCSTAHYWSSCLYSPLITLIGEVRVMHLFNELTIHFACQNLKEERRFKWLWKCQMYR